MIDHDKASYKRAMEEWWKKLTPAQQREMWKKDSQLIFYVQKPKYLRNEKTTRRKNTKKHTNNKR